MLLFTVLSTNLAAQEKTLYSVRKLCPDTVIVTEAMRSDTMHVEDALKVNSSFPKGKELERNRVIFREMKK